MKSNLMDNIKHGTDCLKSCPKRQKTEKYEYICQLNNTYHKKIKSISEAYRKGEAVELENKVKVISHPFTCCILPNLIKSNDYLKSLKNELTQLDLQKKMNDLYQFEQSEDLGNSPLSNICKFKKFLQDEMLKWLKEVTKIPLNDKIDISCSSYALTDHLLCHDDELEGRRIAFIFYLVPEWNETDGGSLDLFNTVDSQPNEVCQSIVPRWNNFVFFEVSPVSYHQVSEVLTSKERIALSGWFNGPPLKPSVPVQESVLLKEPSQHEINITQWINPVYLDGQTQLDIRETFEDDSEISLPDFLQPQKYEAVCEALNDCEIQWKRKGPANRRKVFETSDDGSIPMILRECQKLFTSEAFLLILSNMTALKLHPECEEDAKLGKVLSCIRKWLPGCYTLLHDQSFSQMFSLNAIMYFNCPDWDPGSGGYSSFVSVEENDELLRIEPASNSLALVYATEGTSHFVKYINCKANKNMFPFYHDIFSMYVEEDGDNENEE